MTSQESSNPAVHRLVAAINDGDRDALLATLTPDATLTDDGNSRSFRGWIDREIFSAHGHMNVEHVSTPEWDALCPAAFSQIHDQPNTDSAIRHREASHRRSRCGAGRPAHWLEERHQDLIRDLGDQLIASR